MQPISDFDDRFQIIRSLIITKELPIDWYTDEAYCISFTTDNQKVTKLTVSISKDDTTIIREYEPIQNQDAGTTSKLFMLKTSEVLHESAEPL